MGRSPSSRDAPPAPAEPFVPRKAFVGVMRISDDVPRASARTGSGGAAGGGKTPPAPPEKRAWSGPERRRAVPPIVLLVDEERDRLDLYRQSLLFAGYRVELATGGVAALDSALATRPDVIIMDVATPGTDGLEATRRIQELKATRQIPVIALSADGESPPEWAVAAGCETYLHEPLLPQDLAVEIERVMAARR